MPDVNPFHDESFRKIRTLEDFEKVICKEKERFGSFRTEHQRLYSTLSKCIKPMQPILEIIQKGMGNTPYAPACVVFGAAFYLLQACGAVSKAYDGIEELFAQVSNITARLQVYERQNIETSLETKITDILAFILEIIGKAEACIKRKRFKQWARSVFLQEDDIISSMNKLQKYVETELGLVIALTYGGVKDLQSTTTDVRADVKVVIDRLDDVITNQRNDRQGAFTEADERKLHDALRTKTTTDDIAREHVANVERLTKRTGSWIRDDIMFQAWEQEKAPVLWVFGKPGVGKTMLAARTIEVLQNKYPQHADIPSLISVSYIYFKDDNPGLQDCAQIWKAAALQIVQAIDRFKKHVIMTLDKDQDAFISARRMWQQLFLDFFTEDSTSQSHTSLAYIVVDGLDECPKPERIKFLSCLSALVDRRAHDRKCRIQVAVFARPDVRADTGFEKVGLGRQERIIEVTPDRNIGDIERFIKQRLSEIDVLKVLKQRKANKEYESLAKQIYSSVQSRSQGMFLWASLVFDQICNLSSPEAIRKTLREALEGLDDMLHHVFSRNWRFRYSSLFDLTGRADRAEVEDVAAEGVDDTLSDMEDFAFLDKPEIQENDEVEDEEYMLDQEMDTASPLAILIQDAFNIPHHWKQTTVTFNHARIRDYLLTEGEPSTRRWHDCTVVPSNLNMTRFHVVHACIQLLRTNIADKYSVMSLKDYAKVNWIQHLSEVDYLNLSTDAAIETARMLSKLLHDGPGFLSTSYRVPTKFIRAWFSTDKNSNLVRNIITEHIADIDEDKREWALSVNDSGHLLFQPLIAACARTWLTKTGWDDVAYSDISDREFWIMFAFSTLTAERTNDIRICKPYMKNIPLESIELIANLEPLPKSENWYVGVAWIMMRARKDSYTERAIQYFKTSLDMKPGGWIAMKGLQAAVKWMEDAITNVPQAASLDGTDFCLKTEILKWRMHISRRQDRVKIAQEVYEDNHRFCYRSASASDSRLSQDNDSSILLSIKYYIQELFRAKEYIRLKELLYELDTRATCETTRTLWVVCMRANWEAYLAFVLSQLGRLTRVSRDDAFSGFMNASIDRAVNLTTDTISENAEITLAVEAAQWQYHYAHRPEESIGLWENIVILVDQSSEVVQQSHAWERTIAASFSSLMYFNAAKSAHEVGTDSSAPVSKLENLAKHKQGGKWYYRASYPALILGLWLHEYAKSDEETWRACIRPSIKQALDLLSDEDPWNDQYAYAQLGQALLFAGDSFNALIALGISTKPLAEPRDLPEKSSTDEEKPQSDCFEDGAARIAEETRELRIGYGEREPDIGTMVVPQIEKDSSQTCDHVEDGGAQDALLLDHEEFDTSTDNGQDGNSPSREAGERGEEAAEGKEEYEEEGYEEEEYEEEEYGGEEEYEGEEGYKEEEGSETTAFVNPKYAGFTFMWSCDGPCETPQNSYAELHFCRVCNDVCFCENCIELVKTDQMPFRCCASDHLHVRVFPMIEEATQLADALVEEHFEVQQEWLSKLRDTWDC